MSAVENLRLDMSFGHPYNNYGFKLLWATRTGAIAFDYGERTCQFGAAPEEAKPTTLSIISKTGSE